jgi:hypothetical protein
MQGPGHCTAQWAPGAVDGRPLDIQDMLVMAAAAAGRDTGHSLWRLSMMSAGVPEQPGSTGRRLAQAQGMLDTPLSRRSL